MIFVTLLRKCLKNPLDPFVVQFSFSCQAQSALDEHCDTCHEMSHLHIDALNF